MKCYGRVCCYSYQSCQYTFALLIVTVITITIIIPSSRRVQEARLFPQRKET